MKSLTSLVFNTYVVLQVVIKYVGLNLVLRRYVISEARFKILKTSQRGSVRGCCILLPEIKIATICLTMRIFVSNQSIDPFSKQ